MLKLNEIKIVESGCDGMSCAQIALKEESVEYCEYNATELNDSAISLTQHNFPETVQHGDFKNINEARLKMADFFIAGVPCQSVSINGKKLKFDDERALFHQYAFYKQHLRPEALFLLENVGSMSKDIKRAIDEMLGVIGVEINSNEFCAQNRSRIYWTNIPVPPVWNTREKLESPYRVCHILEKNPDEKLRLSEKKISEQLFAPTKTDGVITLNPRRHDGRQTYQQDRIYDSAGKFPALTATLGNRFNIKDESGTLRRLSIREQARLQTIPDWYDFSCVSDLQASHGIGNGMTIKAIRYILRHAI